MKKTDKKLWKKLTAIGAAAVLSFSFVACNVENSASDLSAGATGYAYMAIDINPSVEVVFKDGKATSVTAANDDAAILLNGENFVGQTAEEVSGKIVELAESMGYLNETNHNVKITVAADSEELAAEIETQAKEAAQKSSDLAKVNSNPRLADNRTCKELQAKDGEVYKDLTPAKVRLIQSIMGYDPSMTYEKGASMKYGDLADMLEDLVEDHEDIVGEELKNEYETKYSERIEALQLRIAEIYGEEYKAAWEKYVALEKAADTIEEKAENAVISDEDVTLIMTLLGIEDKALIEIDGKVTVDGVEAYADKHFDDDREDEDGEEEESAEDLEDALEEILDKYDDDSYLLTAEDLETLSAIWGETLSLETMEDLEEFVETQEDELEELRKNIQLSEEQKAQLESVRAEMKTVKEQVREDMKKAIEDKKAEFHALKEKKLGKDGPRF